MNVKLNIYMSYIRLNYVNSFVDIMQLFCVHVTV